MKSGSSKFRYRGIVIGCVCLTVFICGSKTAFGQTSSNLRTISTTYSLPLITSATLPSSHQSRLRSSPIYGTKLSPTVTLDMGQDHQLDSTPTSSSFSLSGLSLLSATSTTSSISAPTSLVPAAYSLPQPFDETLAASFSTSCLSFFYTFLADPSFEACVPLSLLLSSSKGFFDAQKSPNSLLPYVLSAGCSAPSTCSSLMKSLADSITSISTCKDDLANGNALANQALTGFNNYDIMRAASCQKNANTSKFCFAEASASANRSSLYFYYLPLGTVLPSGTKPSCDTCTQGLLNIYSGYASDPGLLISKTYISGSTAVSQSCGPGFVPFAPTRATSGTARYLVSGSLGSPLLVGLLLLIMIGFKRF